MEVIPLPTNSSKRDILPKKEKKLDQENSQLIQQIATNINVFTSFPIGAKIDYFGTGIKGTITTRDYEISIANGDDFDMKGWFVANGQESTPDCIDKFVRNEAISGVGGGSDDAVVVAHTHNTATYINGLAGDEPVLTYAGRASPVWRADIIQSTGESGVGKNVPAKISAIPIIRMS